MIAPTARDNLRRPHQHGVDDARVGRVHRKRILVADGFGISAFAGLGNLAVEPAARVRAARFSRQRQAPFPEALFEKRFVEPREVSDLADATLMQVALGDLAHSRDLTYVKGRQEASLAAQWNPQNAMRLSLI